MITEMIIQESLGQFRERKSNNSGKKNWGLAMNRTWGWLKSSILFSQVLFLLEGRYESFKIYLKSDYLTFLWRKNLHVKYRKQIPYKKIRR